MAGVEASLWKQEQATMLNPRGAGGMAGGGKTVHGVKETADETGNAPPSWRRRSRVKRAASQIAPQCLDAEIDEAAHLGRPAPPFRMHHVHRHRRQLVVAQHHARAAGQVRRHLMGHHLRQAPVLARGQHRRLERGDGQLRIHVHAAGLPVLQEAPLRPLPSMAAVMVQGASARPVLRHAVTLQEPARRRPRAARAQPAPPSASNPARRRCAPPRPRPRPAD